VHYWRIAAGLGLIGSLLLLGLTLPAGAGAGSTLFINEIHYDNAGADTGEAVEIAGPAGVNLAGWSLALYNGADGAVYATIPLSGSLPNLSGGFGVAVFPIPGLQNGAPDGIALVNNGAALQFLSYEGAFAAVSGPAGGQDSTDIGVAESSDDPVGRSLQLTGSGAAYASFAWAGPQTATLGALNQGQTFTGAPPPPAPGRCGDPATAIHAVQGSGAASPLAGVPVVVEGVVVGDFDGENQLRGFFLQEESAQSDGDAFSSEGMFVYHAAVASAAAVGDVIRVSGIVTEYRGLTELIASPISMTTCAAGVALPTPALISLPVADLNDWEAWEGMRVSFPQTLTVSGNFTHGRYGEVDLTVPGRLFNPTAVLPPGPAALAMQELNNRSRIQLDDGSSVQNPLPLPPYLDANGTLRAGDTLAGVIGVLHYAFGVYEVHPTAAPAITTANPRPAQPEAVGGSLRIAAFNVLNYFTTIDNGQPLCGPASGQDCRGANTAEEFARQRAKIIAAIHALNADIVGVIELENNPAASIQDLVAGLNGLAGVGVYSYIDTGAIGTDAIRVALIYKPAQVTPVGPFAILNSSVDPRFLDTKNRPSLAQTFQENGANERVTVSINHFKSKGSSCGDVNDPDTGDLQGNCNVTRTRAAEALVDWLAANPTGAGTGDNLIIGDLNAYAQEDPVLALKAAGYSDLIAGHQASPAYSYVFDGQFGYLDHALASPSLTARVRGATEWHINADEPVAFDYNNYNQPLLYQPDPYRSSDHDPLLVGLCESTLPALAVTATPSLLTPLDHQLIEVTTNANATDRDPAVTFALLGVTSSEPDGGLGDGDLPGDIEIVDATRIRLRAERAAGGGGRSYTITYQATDDCGNVGIGSATVFALTPDDLTERLFLPLAGR
jgi:predicted extracellular nuclease